MTEPEKIFLASAMIFWIGPMCFGFAFAALKNFFANRH